MFSHEELQSLDPNYFVIITADEYDVTVMSRNTKHYWYLHCTGYPGTVIASSFINTNSAIRIISMDAETA